MAPAKQDSTSLGARSPGSSGVNVVVETPKGSRNKYKFDEEIGAFRLDKILPAGASFPFDFGFVPHTRAEDGDPVDVLVVGDEPTFPGCVLTVRLLGVIEAEQTEKGKTFRNDRLVGMAVTRVNRPEARSLGDLPARLLSEIEHFFLSYNRAEKRPFAIVGRAGPKAAAKLIEQGIRAYRSHRAPHRATPPGR